MSTVHLIPILFGGVTLFLAIAILGLLWATQTSREATRLAQMLSQAKPLQGDSHSRKKRLEDFLSGFAVKIRSRLGMKLSTHSQEDLVSGGYRAPYANEIYLAIQYLTPLLGIVIGSLIRENTFFWMMALGGGGFLIPGIALKAIVKRRKDRILRGLPDATDLLVICVDAGLGLDQALLRVGDELAVSHKEIQQEFNRVQLEQRAGVPRLEAWDHLSRRLKIAEVTTFVSMLHQTDRFGTPIVRALSEFSEEIRTKRRQHAEEAAAKTKVKIVFPLVFFIFPCLFIVLLAPALMDMSEVFSGFAK